MDMLVRIARKWALKVQMACSAALWQWTSGGQLEFCAPGFGDGIFECGADFIVCDLDIDFVVMLMRYCMMESLAVMWCLSFLLWSGVQRMALQSQW